MLTTEYTPAELTVQLLDGVAEVLPWVGAGVGGGVILMFAFLGIRAGFRFFRELIGEREPKGLYDDDGGDDFDDLDSRDALGRLVK